MDTLDQAVEFLVSQGLRAQRRFSTLGDTIMAMPANGEVIGDIEVFPAALHIVLSGETWEIVNYARSGPAETVRCESLDEACTFVVKRLRHIPDVDALVDCGRRVAANFGLPSPPDGVLRRKIYEILYDRGAVQSEVIGLITRAEAVNLLLAHLETLICDHAHVPQCNSVDDAENVKAVELAWFGATDS